MAFDAENDLIGLLTILPAPCVQTQVSGVDDELLLSPWIQPDLTFGNFGGDGHGDLVVGVPHNNRGGLLNAGAVQILYGALFGDGFDSGNTPGWSFVPPEPQRAHDDVRPGRGTPAGPSGRGRPSVPCRDLAALERSRSDQSRAPIWPRISPPG